MRICRIREYTLVAVLAQSPNRLASLKSGIVQAKHFDQLPVAAATLWRYIHALCLSALRSLMSVPTSTAPAADLRFQDLSLPATLLRALTELGRGYSCGAGGA
jgi:hypothetical protein